MFSCADLHLKFEPDRLELRKIEVRQVLIKEIFGFGVGLESQGPCGS